jgi:hypothetical protein
LRWLAWFAGVTCKVIYLQVRQLVLPTFEALPTDVLLSYNFPSVQVNPQYRLWRAGASRSAGHVFFKVICNQPIRWIRLDTWLSCSVLSSLLCLIMSNLFEHIHIVWSKRRTMACLFFLQYWTTDSSRSSWPTRHVIMYNIVLFNYFLHLGLFFTLS